MIKVENVEVFGFEHAIRAMRHPLESYSKSDSDWKDIADYDEMANIQYIVGEKDLQLMQKLYKAGVEHRTYARMIEVWMDVTAPLYWWKEADRYSVGKAQISTSTMHSIHKKPFELDDFSHEHLIDFHGKGEFSTMGVILNDLNWSREKYLETGNKDYWWQMIQLLPSSYNQKRTIMMSYEVVFKIIHERSGHKLNEWCDFVEILKELPYVREIMDLQPKNSQIPGQMTIEEILKP